MTQSVLTKVGTLLFAISIALFGATAFAGAAAAAQCDGPAAATNPNCAGNGPGGAGSNGPGDHNDENGNNNVNENHGQSADHANPNADCNALGEGNCTTPVTEYCPAPNGTVKVSDGCPVAPVYCPAPNDTVLVSDGCPVTSSSGGSTPEQQAAIDAAAVEAAPDAVAAAEAGTVNVPAAATTKPAKVNTPAAATVPAVVPAGDGSSLPQTPMVAFLVLVAAAATAAGAGLRLAGSKS